MVVFVFLEKLFFFFFYGCLLFFCKIVYFRSYNLRLKISFNYFVVFNEFLCKCFFIIFLLVLVFIMFVFVNNKVLFDMYIKCLVE